ncbi:Slam-dependent surface lipoprotein [Neisseria canis]|uniref:Uncharacterized protein n=1 Tax=Neisseria canis TaxID=493 RepID=A0A1X3CY56_9NEIS|nr:Slam-dependent surface lipoprotein [Neisseria canis]OSI12465.1 hypothetical protein BWD07_05005 [Neisseria canis]VEF02782.1 Uncharacterised protein [Neisseria canis]
MKKHQLILLAGAALSLAPTAFAVTAEGLSDTTHITVGAAAPDNQGTHQAGGGEPGIGAKGFHGGKRVSFFNLASLTRNNRGGTMDKHGVSRIPASTANHRPNLGAFNFQQVIGHEAYYGEWTQAGDTKGDTRTVYYSGRHKATNVPTAGTAIYHVKGINRYNGANLMAGTLRADFGKKTLHGALNNSSFTLGINAKIDPAKASFVGTATAPGQRGVTSGHFYGNRATGVAGIAKFQNRAYDTAFGGKR